MPLPARTWEKGGGGAATELCPSECLFSGNCCFDFIAWIGGSEDRWIIISILISLADSCPLEFVVLNTHFPSFDL